ncbi:hypothetical protein, partial [Kitasatospora putterlickiae]
DIAPTDDTDDTDEADNATDTATETEEDDLPAVLQALNDETRSRWPSDPGRPGFHPELLTPAPQIALGRASATDHRELARGLRLDALRLKPPAGDALHRKLAGILRTDTPPAGARLPGFGDVLDPVRLGQRSAEGTQPEQLPALWERLVLLLSPKDATLAAEPPHVMHNQQRSLCVVVQHALDLVAVARESLLVPSSGVVRANGLQHISVLDDTSARNWEAAVFSWLKELSRIGERTNQERRTTFMTKLTKLDHVLAQVITDPLPESGSWWYDGRRRLRGEVYQLITKEGGVPLGNFDDYPTKNISTVADTRPLSGRAPNTVLWWLKLPYDPRHNQAPERGEAICSDRQSNTARRLGH